MDLYRRHVGPDWVWFEDVVTYCNAKLPHALLLCGHSMSRPSSWSGLKTLDWLVAMQTAEGGYFVRSARTDSVIAAANVNASISNRSKRSPWSRRVSKPFG